MALLFPVLRFSEGQAQTMISLGVHAEDHQSSSMPSGQLSSASEAPNDNQSDGPQPSYCMPTEVRALRGEDEEFLFPAFATAQSPPTQANCYLHIHSWV